MSKMKVNDCIHAIAGLFIMGSLVLSIFHSQYWLYFTGFVGLNLFQYGFTGFCPMALILRKMGVPE